MWKCKNCETLNQGSACVVCGRARESNEEKIQSLENDIPNEKNVDLTDTKRKKAARCIYIVLIILLSFFIIYLVLYTIIEHCYAEKPSYTAQKSDSGVNYEQKDENVIKNNHVSKTVPKNEAEENESDNDVYDEDNQDEHNDDLKNEQYTMIYDGKIDEAQSEIQDDIHNDKINIKSKYSETANDIEIYSENHLNTSQTQYDLNHESEIVFKKWDDLLNDVYNYLKSIMPKSEFDKLKADEINWIIEKENSVKEAASEWDDDSGKPLACNMVAIQYTQERCYYLISLIN